MSGKVLNPITQDTETGGQNEPVPVVVHPVPSESPAPEAEPSA